MQRRGGDAAQFGRLMQQACPATITGFSADWTEKNWLLPHGGHQTPTGDIVRPAPIAY